MNNDESSDLRTLSPLSLGKILNLDSLCTGFDIALQSSVRSMTQACLSILYVSPTPIGPPRFGAQARMFGLMSQLARSHDLTAVMLIDELRFDAEECRRAMKDFCREVVLVPAHIGELARRSLQLRSLVSTRSFERLLFAAPALQPPLDRLLRTRRFDVVNLEFPSLGNYEFRQAPPGERLPAVVVDSHNIDYDLARQHAEGGDSLARRIYAGANWRKLRREELGTYRDADGVYLCSANDEQRLLDQLPGVRTAVIPNAADVLYYQPRSTDPSPDGRTIVFFGLLSYAPNVDGVIHFVQKIWPRIAEVHPQARCKFIGGQPPSSLLALAGPRIEFTGFVSDLRPHLAEAACIVVPLRIGGGTRLKIVEGMAMGKPIVSTTLGAEGIEAIPGRDILIEDEPAKFANAVNHLLADPDLAARIGQSARRLAVAEYSWSGAAQALERFYYNILEGNNSRDIRSEVGYALERR